MDPRPWHRFYDYSVPVSIPQPQLCVADLLQIPANAYPDKAAVHFLGREITFWELRQQVLRMANALEALGVQKGDRVGIHLPICPQYIIAYYAVLSLGAIVVNLNPLYKPDELEGVFLSTGISTLFTIDTAMPTVFALSRRVEIRRIIVTRSSDYAGTKAASQKPLELEEGWLSFSALLENCTSTRRPRVDLSIHDPAMIQFTGGTTGIPKGAVLTHGNVVAATIGQSLWISPVVQLTPPERRFLLGAIPFFHIYGNIAVINLSVFNCATQILVPQFEINEMMNVLSRYKEILAFPTVPTMITAVVSSPRAEELGLDKKLGLLNSGGRPCLWRSSSHPDMGIFYSEGWSMSETPVRERKPPSRPVQDRKHRHSGLGTVFVLWISKKGGNRTAGRTREMVIKGPTSPRVLEQSQETASRSGMGAAHGDIAIQTRTLLFIIDRKKDMIIAGGFNIYPREIDEVLHQHPKIQSAIAVGVPTTTGVRQSRPSSF
jgi:long-chain acyl-CoA synthetase